MQPKFCIQCGAEMLPGKKFCMNCGTPAEAPAASPNPYGGLPAYAQPQPVPAQPPPGIVTHEPGSGKALSMLGYLGYLLVMSLPVAGLVLAIIWGVKPAPAARSNLAKAMIVYNVVGFLIIVIFMVMLHALLSQVVNISVDIFGWKILG